MVACVVKKSNGEQCKRRPAEGNEYCAHHRKMYAARVVHGKYARPEILGVPKRYHGQYQAFLASDKPFDLRNEMAILRTLVLEMRDVVDVNIEIRSGQIAHRFADRLRKLFEEEDSTDVEPLVRTCTDAILQVLSTELLSLSSMGELREVSDMVGKVVKAAEVMKKIQEGVKLEVSIDTNLLIRFVQTAIFPVITDMEQRRQIIQRAFLLGLRAPQPGEYEPSPVTGEVYVETEP